MPAKRNGKEAIGYRRPCRVRPAVVGEVALLNLPATRFTYSGENISERTIMHCGKLVFRYADDAGRERKPKFKPSNHFTFHRDHTRII